jgi:Flp pilus assembly protein TadG
MISFDPRNDPVMCWLRAVLGAHSARLRAAARAGDRGASAVELAVITAVLIGVAIIITTVIINFVNKQKSAITNQVVPNP